MTDLEKLQIELNSINWMIGQATTEEARQELENTHKNRIQEILSEIEILKNNE
jgi:hypothetical protein